jgi:hypothetical protein
MVRPSSMWPEGPVWVLLDELLELGTRLRQLASEVCPHRARLASGDFSEERRRVVAEVNADDAL